MTLLVTGGAGYIGSHMVWAARDAGRDVVVIDNLSTGRRACLPDDIPLYVADIADTDALATIFDTHDITAILHFAGSIIVPESVENPLLYYGNNTANSRTLIACAVARGVSHFIFSSTAAVYGDPAIIPVAEDADLRPLSPYGTSKLMTEMMLRDVAAAHPMTYAALRYFNVAGADPKGRTGQATPNATHLIKVACQAALGERDQLAVFGNDYETLDGTGVRDYIHVSDLAAAHMSALAYLEAGGHSDIFNCGYGTGYSVMEVIEAVKAVSGVDFPVAIHPRRAGDSPKVVARVDKIHAHMDWTPEHADLHHIIRTALTFEKQLKAA